MKFIRKNGKIIPIRDGAKGATRTVARGAVKGAAKRAIIKGASRGFRLGQAAGIATAAVAAKKIKRQPIKVDPVMNAVGIGAAVASGVAGAAGFSHGAKGFFGSLGVSLGLDAVSTGANIASVRKGPGTTKQKALQVAKQEARNIVIGNAVYGAGLLAVQKNREKVVEYASKFVQFGRKYLAGV